MIAGLDHVVLTVRDLEATRRFYVDGLGMRFETFEGGRHAVRFGQQKINLHVVGHELEPRAVHPTPGSGDLCFLSAVGLDAVIGRMTARGFPVLEGPVARTGATGPITSVYFRDPDGNLIEVATPACD